MTKEEIQILENNELQFSEKAGEIYDHWIKTNGVVSVGLMKNQNPGDGENPYFIEVERNFKYFEVKCDEETNDSEAIANNELKAKITIHYDPIPEFVRFDFLGIDVTLPVTIVEAPEELKNQVIAPEGFVGWK